MIDPMSVRDADMDRMNAVVWRGSGGAPAVVAPAAVVV
jgi:hypothetical protein